MNVDEAIEVITGAEPSCLEHLAGAVLVAEVERLRAWNIRWRDVSAKLRLTLAELSEELAAAEAASVVPVQVIDCYSFGDDVEVVCKCGDDADRLSGWIRERMKDASPPAT